MDNDEYFPPGASSREIGIRRRVHRLAEFYQHLLIYTGVISLLWVVNAYTVYTAVQPGKGYAWWVIWPTLGWGIGLLIHALSVLPVWSLFSPEWEERKVKELMDRERTS
jgi:hypothetical protein